VVNRPTELTLNRFRPITQMGDTGVVFSYETHADAPAAARGAHDDE
jgi:hypothetical protein